ncbi:MAG: hypothetical protein ACP5P9_11260 [Acidimicrobiales bacterium]
MPTTSGAAAEAPATGSPAAEVRDVRDSRPLPPRVPSPPEHRAQVLTAACTAHPERFVREAPEPPALPTAAWTNKPREETPTAQWFPEPPASLGLRAAVSKVNGEW